MLVTILKLKLKQAVGESGFRAVLRFLAPNIFVGIFMALSIGNLPASDFIPRVGLVACGVALFTLVAETRKLFFMGGDLENFYFVQPTKISRLASILLAVILDLAIIFSIITPSLLIQFSKSFFLTEIIFTCGIVVCISLVMYLLIIFLISSLSNRIADLSLTFLQIFMALVLLAIFQLPLGTVLPHDSLSLFISCILLIVSCSIFFIFPFQERLVSSLNRQNFGTRLDFVEMIERIKWFVVIRSKEEEAGFLFFLTNVFRNSSLRLSTIGIAATPVMVAVYWSMRGVNFAGFETKSIFFHVESVGALASLIISGIFVYYYLSQNILSSRDHEAKWMISQIAYKDGARHGFDSGRFVLGFRKSFMLTVHVPMTVLIFFVILTKESFASALISTLTFYLLTHVAASWFFIVQKQLPFSLPFTQIGPIEILGIMSMFVYSFIVIIVLYFCYGSLQNILITDIFGFILTGLLEIFSVKIVKQRVKFV